MILIIIQIDNRGGAYEETFNGNGFHVQDEFIYDMVLVGGANLKKKHIIIASSILLTLVLLIGGTGYYFSNVLILKDNGKKYATNPHNQEAIEAFATEKKETANEQITVKSPYGYDLIGYYFPAIEKTNKTIIVVHGYTNAKENQQRFINMFHNMGYNVIAYDQRNHGESGGDYTTYGILESRDLQAVVNYAKEKTGKNSIIGIHGTSMGAATTVQYAGQVEDGANFYIIDCAYSNFAVETLYRLSEDYSFIPKFLQKPIVSLGDSFLKWRKDYSIAEASPIDVVQNIKKPLLFINTKTDDYIPPYMTQELYDKATAEKYIYWTETGKHAKAFDVNPAQYEKTVKQFMDKVLAEK